MRISGVVQCAGPRKAVGACNLCIIDSRHAYLKGKQGLHPSHSREASLMCALQAWEAPLGSCMVLKEERSWRPSLGDGGHLTEKPRANVWCVENAGATFLVCSPESGSPDGEPCSAPVQGTLPWSMRICMSEQSTSLHP